MSGFVGWVHFDGQPVARSELARLTALLERRGPDRQAIWCQENAGWGHALLATSARAAREQQPLVIAPDLILVADARLDGRDELRSQLRRIGCPLSAEPTDPELIGQAYLAWGDRVLNHLQGDFAFVIWQPQQQHLFAARDPLGVKPFFYAQMGATWLASNDLRCLRQHAAISRELNEAAIADFLLFDFNREPTATSFRQIQRLPGGHWLTARPEGCHSRRYWTLPVPPRRRYRRATDCLAEFRHHLEQAVGDRLPEARAAIYLSGGLDSSTLAAAVRAVQPDLDLHGYTTVYERLFADSERHYTPLVARALDLPLHLLPADDYSLYRAWAIADPAALPPEPNHSPLLQIDCDHLHRIAGHSRVALYGEGADEALQPSTVLEALRGLPLPVSLGALARCLFVHRLRPEWGTGAFAWWRQRRRPRSATLPPFPDWLHPDFARRSQARERWQQVWQPQKTDAPLHPWRARAYRALAAPVWLPTLAACDPGFLNVPVETRLPFLDLRLLDFLLALPPLPWFVRKELLRQAGRDRLPTVIRQRQKTALGGLPFYCALQQGEFPWQILGGASNSNISAYVDCDRLLAIATHGKLTPIAAWGCLRPVSLDYWLQRQW